MAFFAHRRREISRLFEKQSKRAVPIENRKIRQLLRKIQKNSRASLIGFNVKVTLVQFRIIYFFQFP